MAEDAQATELRQRVSPRPPPLTSKGLPGEEHSADVAGLADLRPQHSELKEASTLLHFSLFLFAIVLCGMAYSAINFSQLDNLIRARTPASAMTTSTITPPLPSYFSDKRNIFNQLGVKKAWAWTTFVFSLLIFTQPFPTRSTLLRSLARYALATLYWLLFTLYVADQVLVLSGANCVPTDPSLNGTTVDPILCIRPMKASVPGEAGMQGLNVPISKPRWSGGHDVSGHTFLLVHASLFLVSELAILARHAKRNTIGQMSDPVRSPGTEWAWHSWVRKLVGLLVGVWCWMLLMTAVYFHTPPEKLSGFIVGIAGVLTIRWLLP